MDGDTDSLIQATLRDSFANFTLLTVAHRLHTVLDYDKILVMSEGSVAEYGTAQELLNDSNSLFYDMAMKAGIVSADSTAKNRLLQSETIPHICATYKFYRRIKDAPRKPRRGATSHEERLAIVAAVADNPRCSAQDIKVNFGLKASKSTVKRRLHQAGLKSRTAEQKVLLRTANKDKRLQFAQRHAGWIEQDWKKVVFTDESSFTTSWDQKTRIRRPDCTL
ncbi:hypothetical protein HPB50_010254 [Hyalomma asiaticum]|uniref:Uncharacterized protein n=1 Tax=Hyalomma asiaticum TaxID=266040 RepID=A0ACB7RI33_HYAAI|nr:hypothetical protein HPB50_010254 [Hyalomma asiaticum]